MNIAHSNIAAVAAASNPNTRLDSHVIAPIASTNSTMKATIRTASELSTRTRTSRVKIRRSEEHTSELQSRQYLVCRLLLEKKKNNNMQTDRTQLTIYK